MRCRGIKRLVVGATQAMLLGWIVLVSCDRYNYVDDLQGLGQRVEVLEAMVLEANEELAALSEVVRAVESNGYVTSVRRNADGTCSIEFDNGQSVTLSDGRQGRDGRDGRDGKEADVLISVAQGEDSLWYWVVNGEWLRDGEGERIPASAADGRDGKDGRDGRSASETGAVVPQVRINPDSRTWELSADGGQTWTDLGTSADGADGQDGQDGKDGADDIFLSIDVAPDGRSITFILRDGRTFTVPII